VVRSVLAVAPAATQMQVGRARAWFPCRQGIFCPMLGEWARPVLREVAGARARGAGARAAEVGV
jgi:hypothetical protein